MNTQFVNGKNRFLLLSKDWNNFFFTCVYIFYFKFSNQTSIILICYTLRLSFVYEQRERECSALKSHKLPIWYALVHMICLKDWIYFFKQREIIFPFRILMIHMISSTTTKQQQIYISMPYDSYHGERRNKLFDRVAQINHLNIHRFLFLIFST